MDQIRPVLDQERARDRCKSSCQFTVGTGRIDKQDVEPDQAEKCDQDQHGICNCLSGMYAKTFFEEYDVDALTVAPYMGEDSITPFLKYTNKWSIVLALTSNKGSMDFQFTCDEKGERLFEKVLRKCCTWGNDTNIMYVVGATQGSFFKEIRAVVPNHFLLVPGVGAQGGSLQEVCKYGIIHDCGLLINSSRGIIYASNGEDFAEVAGQKAQELQKEMCIELGKYRCFE